MKKEASFQFFDVISQPDYLVYNDIIVTIDYEYGRQLQLHDLVILWKARTQDYRPSYWLDTDENKQVPYQKVSGHSYTIVNKSWHTVPDEQGEEKLLLILELNWIFDHES